MSTYNLDTEEGRRKLEEEYKRLYESSDLTGSTMQPTASDAPFIVAMLLILFILMCAYLVMRLHYLHLLPG